MNRLKDLLRSFTVLNLSLAAAILLAAGVILFLHVAPDAGISSAGNPETAKVPAVQDPAGTGTPEMQNYAVVAEKNLFHPERRIPPRDQGRSPAETRSHPLRHADYREREDRLHRGQEIPLLDAGQRTKTASPQEGRQAQRLHSSGSRGGPDHPGEGRRQDRHQAGEPG